jgi:hypothetical protein
LRKEIKSRHGKIKADAGFKLRDAKRFKEQTWDALKAEKK